MQVFEFYFNPKLKPDLIFESFCYEPENIYEKRVGSLYMMGILKNVLPQNLHFLDKLSKVIREKYYSPVARSPEKSLKESLRRANGFFEDIAKRGDVSWLGNLSFAVLSLKNFELNFAKVGDLKIFLLRRNKVIDIDKKIRFEEIEPYPLKIFLNIVSSKLAEDDIILILSKEVSEFFQKEDLLTEIAKISPFGEKKLNGILNAKKEKLQEISGICLLISLTKEKVAARKETIVTPPQIKEFSFKETISPLVAFFKKTKLFQIKIPKIKFLKLPKVEFPRIKFPKLTIPKLRLTIPGLETFKGKVGALIQNKNTILVGFLILFLIVGFFVFQRESKEKLKEYQANFAQIQEKVDEAESFLILKSPQSLKEADSLLKESWEEISFLIKIASSLPKDFREQVLLLNEEVLENLYQLNKLTEISEPEVLFEFKAQEFIPQKMVSDGKNLYFFSPFAQNVFKVNEEGKGHLIETGQTFNLAISIDELILFFSKPNQIISFKNDQLGETFSLETPYPDFSFDGLSSFKSILYFLDKKAGQITKYPYLGNLKWNFPKLWLNPQTKRALGADSLAIDGSIWILYKNSIDKYYGGELQETLNLDLFPYPENFSKIFTSPLFAYLYILEPAQKRFVIINKRGEVVKQFKSEKFDNLLDFVISKDGKIIYLLNGLKVYQIKF